MVMQPRFREKSFNVKLTTFSVAQNIKFGTKLMSYSQSMLKIKMGSPWMVFEIFLMSAVICIRRIFHGNEIT